MDRRTSSGGSSDLASGGLGSFDFDRPPPDKNKRPQRISRKAQSKSQLGPQQRPPQQRPLQYQPPYHQQQYQQAYQQQPYQQQPYQQQPYQQQPYQQQPYQQQPYQQQPYQQAGYGPPEAAPGPWAHSVGRQHGAQYAQSVRLAHAPEHPRSPSAQSDIVRGTPQAAAPGYLRASTAPGVRPPTHHMHPHPHPQSQAQSSAQPMAYPSAMVVGGGMPGHGRIAPSPGLVSAVAAADINRQQREHDLANAMGRRRPTQGGADQVPPPQPHPPLPHQMGPHQMGPQQPAPYQMGMHPMPPHQMPPHQMPPLPEQPFNGHMSADFGMAGPAVGGMGAAPPGRYMVPSSHHSAADARVGRSASSASSSSGYRGGPGALPYAVARPPPHADGSPLRKKTSMDTSSGTVMSAGLAGSRSTPDLNMEAMRAAVNDVAHGRDGNPVPVLPAAFATATQPPPRPRNSHLAPESAPELRVSTDVPRGAAAQAPTGTLATARPVTAGDGGSAAPQSCLTASAGTGLDAHRSGRRPVAPVNEALVALLDNVKPVYPAMLALVAKAFHEIVSQVLQTHERNGLEHAQCFTGRDAVDAINAIIRATDRNLAIVVGRALEQQRLFHDVDYEKRLRDDAGELYAFDDDVVNALLRSSAGAGDDDATLCPPAAGPRSDAAGINGVFVMLTDCYSPTCSSSQPCYSVTCPRQRAQQDHLRRTAKSNVGGEMKQEKLWSMSVPKEIVSSVSRMELDRQERLYELFYGEKDYVRDLCILRDLYMKPLHNGDLVAADRRKNFITKVFKNALAVLAENMELHRALERRQKENFVCYQVGDVFMPFVQNLEAYLEYCANQPYSMHFLEAEKRINKRLVEFLDKTDRRPECRKLGVQHFLTRPPTRLARYPLMLRAVLKKTPEGHPDRTAIPHVIERVEAMLNRINVETGKAQNRLRLFKVDEKLGCTVTDRNDLRLTDDQRRLVRDSQLRKRGGGDTATVQVLLLDHMLLMCKVKVDSQTGEERYALYKRPVPLQMLTICIPDDPSSTRPRMAARRDSTGQPTAAGSVERPATAGAAAGAACGAAPGAAGSATPSADPAPAPLPAAASARPTIISIDNETQRDKYAYPLQITYLGRSGFTTTLYADKLADRKQWYQCIEQQQLELMERHRKFELVPVARQFPAGIRVTTADVYDQGRCVVIGTDHGLYLGVAGKPTSYQRLTHLKHDRVFQLEIHEQLNVMAMVADKDRNLYVYPLDHLMTATSSSRHGQRVKPLHTHVSFFRFGQYQEQDILCSVRSTTLSNQTIIHVYKPVVSQPKSRTLGRFLSLGGEPALADSWKCIKECYIAAESTSLHFLRSRLCVGCSRGFEIVDLATMNTQSLLDPADASLGFINKRDTTHPIALFRVQDGQFLLCYDVFAFYVNRNGQRARSNWMIHWVGSPTSFKFEYPYIMAFDSQFVEIYHVETGSVVQVIITGNCASLSPNKMDVNLCVTSHSPNHPQEVLRIQHLLAKDPL